MIDYSINLFNVLTPSALVAVIGYMLRRWINGTIVRVKELETSTIRREEYGRDCQILRDDIKSLDLKMTIFQNNFLFGGSIYKAFQEEIQRTIQANSRILGQRE